MANQYPNGIDVQFNPSSVAISKSVSWPNVGPLSGATAGRAGGAAGGAAGPGAAAAATANTNRELNAPPIEFGGGGQRTLTLQLFFDVTESGPDADVRDETNKITKLTRIERNRSPTQQPPVC